MRTLVPVVLALLVAIAGLLWFGQRWVMFPGSPFRFSADPPGSATLRVVRTGPEGAWELWHLLPAGTAGAPTIIYAHGNAELIDLWLEPFESLRRVGYGVILVEYPGYGRSRGSASKLSVDQAMAAAYDYATEQPEVDATRIIGYGRSLGGAAVCSASLERKYSALIVQSSFSSVRALARRYGLVDALIRDPFDSVAALQRFEGPVLLLHGEHDRIIGPSHSQALAQAAPAAELQLMPCGHNNCRPPWPEVMEFLTRHGLAPR